MPLFLRILIGVVAGAVMGVTFHDAPIVFHVRNQHLGDLGLLVVRLLKALAVPLIFFAIVDSFARTQISARKGGKMVLICLLNVSVAFAIGLTLMDTFKPGRGLSEHFQAVIGGGGPRLEGAPAPGTATLDPLKNVDGYVPVSLVDPFSKNSVISVVLLSLFVGAALRRVRRRQEEQGETGAVAAVERFVAEAYEIILVMLGWVIQALPLAVFGVVAQVVGRTGLKAFAALGPFLFVILLGLFIHSLVYYPLMAWLAGGKPPRVYLGRGADAVITGLSTNSSLATVPVTLRCLDRMGVSQESSRLAACVGTNLNNDGITLYDAMAALFIAQACGFDLTLTQQGVVVLASLMAGIGIAGIPEAGLIVLPLVLGAVGLPEAVVAAAIPLVLPVDWIIGRVRSGVNVMSDMLVAILLDSSLSAAPPAEGARSSS